MELTPSLEEIRKELRPFELRGVGFLVEWHKLRVGHSFFLKTTVEAEEVAEVLRPLAAVLQYKFVTAQRCEFGYYGVRVWRLS